MVKIIKSHIVPNSQTRDALLARIRARRREIEAAEGVNWRDWAIFRGVEVRALYSLFAGENMGRRGAGRKALVALGLAPTPPRNATPLRNQKKPRPVAETEQQGAA